MDVFKLLYDDKGNEIDNKKCPFCRTPHFTSNEEMVERFERRVEANDPIAIHKLGVFYRDGKYGFPQDVGKALELWHRAAELGYTEAYCNIGNAYAYGKGVETDKKKATYYTELAAIGGDTLARYNLGIEEEIAFNDNRAIKHYMISVRDGQPKSLEEIQVLYSK